VGPRRRARSSPPSGLSLSEFSLSESTLSEFSLIDAFTACFDVVRSPRGPGDDCAVLPAGAGALCVTTDAVVENVHFTRAHFSLGEVGHKALAVNLSDLAAMGARPEWFLCALGLPAGFTLAQTRQLGRGMAKLARTHRIRLAGGNLTTASALSVTLTAAGRVGAGGALLRSGARPGDALYVSGSLGDARLGLSLLETAPRSAPALRQKCPIPRVGLGLVAARFARAAIDVSDGFAQDLGHLCAASGVRAEVWLGRLPLSAALVRHLPDPDAAALFAAAGGEDYELLLAVPPDRAPAFERACARHGEHVVQVGEMQKGRGVRLRTASGGWVAPPRGFDHRLSGGKQAGRSRHLTPWGSEAK